MNRLHRIGIAGIALMLLAGVWLFFAPFMFGYQPEGSHWVNATRNDLWAGGMLTLVGVVSLLAFAGVTVRELVRRAPAGEPVGAPSEEMSGETSR